MQHDERLGRATDASHQARGRGRRAPCLLRQLVPTGRAVHVPKWLGGRSVELGSGSMVLESDHRAIEDKHGHNDDEDDEDKEGSPGENAQLRLSGEHPGALGRSYGVRSYRTVHRTAADKFRCTFQCTRTTTRSVCSYQEGYCWTDPPTTTRPVEGVTTHQPTSNFVRVCASPEPR
eukprot:scaffold74592_cov65-Phaeocystis_antarctica.AAC.2